jgi:glycosyltransferase involved in cell wall biosynthesis
MEQITLDTNKHYKVSVIVLTKNSATTVHKSLESIFNQTRKPDEVIVIDGNSADNTLKIVKQFPVKLFLEPGLGYGHARNIGVKKSEGDILFFIDSDCYAEPQWIEKTLPHFNNPEIAGVTGQLRLWNVEHACARFLAYVGGRMNMPKEQEFVEIAPTMNLALRRDITLKLGGFDENLIRCEDTDLTYKITRQYKLVYDPEAVVWFRGSPNVRIASNKCIRHFIGVGQLFAKHGFKNQFVRFNLVARGFILMIAVTSFFLLPWPVAPVLLISLLTEFIYKTVRMYRKYHDRCVIYYILFFTLWSLASFAILYGLYCGMKQKILPKLNICINRNWQSQKSI